MQRASQTRLANDGLEGTTVKGAGLKGKGAHREHQQGQGKRFVEPYPFTPEQRTGISEALAAVGLGDEMSREIFIGAIAYDLAVLESAPSTVADATATALPPPPEPPRPEPDPGGAQQGRPLDGGALATAAASLCALLGKLSAEQQRALGASLRAHDPFQRDHGPDYLAALRTEIGRLASTAAELAETDAQHGRASGDRHQLSGDSAGGRHGLPEQAASTTEDASTKAATAFIRHAASVYEQCFDGRPDVDAEHPFMLALGAIAEHTGVAIPIAPAQVQQALIGG